MSVLDRHAVGCRGARSALGRPADEDYRPSLAVLPFRTFLEDRADAYFAEGMVDDIIRLLGGLKELLVIARSSTLAFAGAPLDLRRIGHELDVRYVLHGSLRRLADKVRIAVELSEAETGHLIWADRLDGELSDLFELQDRIATRVVGAVAPHVRERELNRSMRKHPSSMTAYDLRCRRSISSIGWSMMPSSGRANCCARRCRTILATRQPIRILRTGTFSVSVRGGRRISPRILPAAARAARAAVERDRNDALGLAFSGHMQSYLLKDYVAAMDLLERALAAGPSCAWAHSMSSLT